MNRSSFVSKLFTPVITLLVLAYFGYQIYGYVSDPFSTTLAYTYQVEDTVDISGYVARRLIDFLSGVAYAGEGKIKKVAANTYIITPYHVELEGDLIDELESNGLYF